MPGRELCGRAVRGLIFGAVLAAVVHIFPGSPADMISDPSGGTCQGADEGAERGGVLTVKSGLPGGTCQGADESAERGGVVTVKSGLPGGTCRGEEGAGRDSPLSGTLRLAGSSSMEEYADALAEGFMEEYPEVTVSVEYIGSGAGIQAVLGGSAHIGTSSRNLREEESAEGAVGHIVGMDGIAVCVDRENRVSELTREQLTDLYTGRFSSWAELGGGDVPVVVVGHEAGSGTREVFEEYLGIRDQCRYANELNSMGAVLARVAVTPGAVGYVSYAVADESVRLLSLDGAAPDMRSMKEGSYPLCRPFVMVTKGELSGQNELVRAWFDYVYSDKGRDAAEQAGIVPVQK